MSIERLLAADIAMNACILMCVQLGLGRLDLKRIAAALAVMELDTALCRIAGIAVLRTWCFQAAFCALSGAALTGMTGARTAASASLCILLSTLAAAGIASLARPVRIDLLAAGCALIISVLRIRRHDRAALRIQLCVELAGKRDRFTALIDTGNRLTDPESRLPVVIVSAGAVPNIAPAAVPPEQARSIPFGALGGGGEIRCVDGVRVTVCLPDGRFVPAPPCRIGIFGGRIPGLHRALAPAEFLFVQNSCMRRFPHVYSFHPSIHIRPVCPAAKGLRMLHRRQRPPSAAAHPR